MAMPKLNTPAVYLPADVANDRPSSGTRREFAKIEAIPLKWPKETKERYDLFDAWHDVAMQILHLRKVSFRLMAVTKKVIRWSEGVIVDTNGDLALRGGGCSERTMKRDVRAHIDLGIFLSELEWKRPGGGKFITLRTLRPSLPVALPDGVALPDLIELSRDNSGPFLEAVRRDARGPEGRDTRGPSTIDHKKGGGDAA